MHKKITIFLKMGSISRLPLFVQVIKWFLGGPSIAMNYGAVSSLSFW